MRLFGSLLAWFLRAVLTSRGSLALENLALRQQLSTYARTQRRPRLKPDERAFWVALSRVWSDWRSPLVLVKPATVVAWHRRGYQRYWSWKCGKPGRPRIPAEHIAFVRRISIDQPVPAVPGPWHGPRASGAARQSAGGAGRRVARAEPGSPRGGTRSPAAGHD
jgi:hypothetical protein